MPILLVMYRHSFRPRCKHRLHTTLCNYFTSFRPRLNLETRRKPSIQNFLISQPCSAALTTAAGSTDNIEETEEFFVLEDKNLLRKSKGSTGTCTKTGLYVLDLINDCSLHPDRSLYNELLRKCTQLNKLKEGRIVHAHLRNSALFKDDVVFQNTILNMYAKCGSLEDAQKLFDEMPTRDMVTWTALITGYAQHDRSEDALQLFPWMLRSGLKPNQFTLSSLLKAAGNEPSHWHGWQLHSLCLKYGYLTDVYVGSSLVDMYARSSLMEDAEVAFDELELKNEVSWNALIAGYARKGEGEHAVELFWKMLRENYRPTHFTYSSIFGACASTGALEQGKWVHAYMIKSGEELIAFVGNTLIDMYAKSGSIEDAIRVFERLKKRDDVVSWNSIITGFAQHGLGREAVKWFEKMLKAKVKPNDITFLCVLTACSHAGLLEEGQHYFNLMKTYSLEPQVWHYVTFVDLLGRAGQLERATKFISDLPIEPTAAVWGALLGACRMHKNMELGAYAAERVFELDPHDSGPHVLLYNIYASAGRWTEAAKVRKMMKESGVKKEPACSWVEIENAVHMFVANDDAHPQREEIHKMWESISEMIKKIGYVPDTSHVLMFVDQQEREVKLQHHSEKLALAFALLNTPHGSTIRIKKNIRVCGDCHSAMKFVSKAVNREIILRDTNRFHHFRYGSCSCRDYW